MATVEDLPRMEACAQEFYASSKHLRKFRIEEFRKVWDTLLNACDAVIFIQEEDGEIIGTIGGLLHPNLYSEKELIAEEFFWFVRTEARGAGVKLYRAFEQWARDNGAQWIQMMHMKDVMPEKVAHFYERIGYEPIETRYEKRLT